MLQRLISLSNLIWIALNDRFTQISELYRSLLQLAEKLGLLMRNGVIEGAGSACAGGLNRANMGFIVLMI